MLLMKYNSPQIRLFAAVIFISALVLSFSLPAVAGKAPPEIGEPEKKMGAEAAAQVVKEYKLSDKAADLKRVREIGAKLAAVANKKEIDALYGTSIITPFEYTFDIIEEKDVNAFCVPSGRIYVYRGLLDFVESDDELALVMAHEVVHASHHHMVYLIKKQSAYEKGEAIALLATIMSGARSSDVYNIQRGIELVKIARLNGYGIEAERDADAGAIIYAMEAGYNPVGLLTFMERLAKRPELVDLGIFRSHPVDAERVANAKALLNKLGVPINRRATTKAVEAQVKMEKIGEVEAPSVILSGKLIYRPSAVGDKTAKQIAEEAASRVNKALDGGLKMHELKSDTTTGVIAAKNTVLFSISEADAKLMSMSLSEATQAAATAIRDVILMQMVDTVH